MKKILLLQGANSDYLGKREPAIYGSTTVDELDAMVPRHAEVWLFAGCLRYEHRREATNRRYRAADEGFDGLVMNPSGSSYSDYALKDCVKGAGLPYIHGYVLAIDAMLNLLNEQGDAA